MSEPDGVHVTSDERPQQCDLCGVVAELRPYGPRGECVCFDCGMRDEPSARLAFERRSQDPGSQPMRRLLDPEHRVAPAPRAET